ALGLGGPGAACPAAPPPPGRRGALALDAALVHGGPGQYRRHQLRPPRPAVMGHQSACPCPAGTVRPPGLRWPGHCRGPAGADTCPALAGAVAHRAGYAHCSALQWPCSAPARPCSALHARCARVQPARAGALEAPVNSQC
ncbi:hypothetical protein KTAU_41720, partial [Thermogemmatispora aurantia]